jgi:hypothetical protein
MAVSTNAGFTWSAPAKVSDERGAARSTDQFFPWVAVDSAGRAHLVWQDKRLDSSNQNFDTFYTSTADGVSFARNVRVSSATSIVGLTTFIGDYNNIAVAGSQIFPVWTDRRARNNDIFTARGVAGG